MIALRGVLRRMVVSRRSLFASYIVNPTGFGENSTVPCSIFMRSVDASLEHARVAIFAV